MKRGEDGFILVAALWLLAGLAALASAYAVYALETAPSAALPEERLRAEASLRAGVELCAFRQLAWPKAARPDGGAFSTLVGLARIDVVFASENARVDLNAASPEALKGLLARLGAPAATAAFVADRIIGWRGPLQESERRREAALYAKAGLGYGPLGAPFDNVLDIALLPGVTPALTKRALPYLTIFASSGKIDPFVADPMVLEALPGATPALVKGLLAARNGPRPDTAAFVRLAGPLKDVLSADANDYVRAGIVATLANRRVRAEVVLKINESASQPYEILYWRDDFDGGES